MRALVTGSAGFVGSTLCERLLFDGVSVLGVDAYTDYYDPLLKQRNVAKLSMSSSFEFVQGDINSLDLTEILKEVDVVFHQAGQPGVRNSWGSDFGYYLDANVSATQRLLEAAMRSPSLSRFVYASSSSVYGDAERYPTEETDRPKPRSPYGVTKLAAEHLVSLYAANFGVPAVSLRYFTVYGPKQRPDMAFNRFIRSALRNEPITLFGDGKQIREFTFVDDIVEANVRAASAELQPGEVINLSGGSSVTVNEVLAELNRIHSRPLNVERLPGVPGDVMRTGGSTTKARDLLDWQPTIPIEEGLLREYEWLRQEEGLSSL